MGEPRPEPEIGLIGAVTRTLNWIALATVILYIALAVIVVLVFLNARHTSNDIKASVRQNETARIGLCALRHDLQKRIESSESFLRDHPRGIPGVPSSLIRAGVRNQKQTLASLDAVKCKRTG